jgi:two-component system LytT family response regulator
MSGIENMSGQAGGGRVDCPANRPITAATLPGHKIRVLIADDEPLARARLRQMLAIEDDTEVVAECETGREAVDAIQSQHPDLAFLDIQMPILNGMDALKALPPAQRPLTIFVTAYSQHAFEAFEVRAVDYLLKPFSVSRFREAFQRARDQMPARQPEQSAPEKTGAAEGAERISVRTGDKTTFLDVQEIDYIEAAANYAIVHVGNTTHVLRESLTSLEEKLPPARFLRLNRSLIANLGFLKEVRHGRRRGRIVTLKNGREFSLTCGVREVRQRLENL